MHKNTLLKSLNWNNKNKIVSQFYKKINMRILNVPKL